MCRYRLHLNDGTDLGEAAYADSVNAGDELLIGPGQHGRVLDVIPIDEPDAEDRAAFAERMRRVRRRQPCCVGAELTSTRRQTLR
jgi:hypothetical protein